MQHLLRRVEQFLFDPLDASRGDDPRPARAVLRYAYALLRDLWAGELNLRATSLVYTTLLSVVPLIALILSVLKGLGLKEDLIPVLGELLRPLGDRSDDLTLRVIAAVDRLQGRLVGTVGFAVLILSALAAIQKIEEAFNFIWHVPRVRAASRRFGDYLALLVVGPLVLVAILGVASGLADHSALAWLRERTPIGLVFTLLRGLTPWLLTSLVLAFLYSFIPNTRVEARAALIAGLATGVAWVAAGRAFSSAGAYSTRLMAIYASFAITLLTLIWLWLSWLILLCGAQLSFYLQNPVYLRNGRRLRAAGAGDAERLALAVMVLVARADGAGAPTLETLAERTGLASGVLAPLVEDLAQAGLIRATRNDGLALARSAHQLRLVEVIGAVRRDRHAPTGAGEPLLAPATELARCLDAAIVDALGERTLADLMPPRPG